MTKTALITGATSGFGRAAARKFIDAAWKVIATGRRQDRLQALRDELGDALYPAAFDIREEAAMRAALEALPERFRGIDLLVNNAGLAQGTRPAQDALLSDWRTMIETNITALVTLTHALVPTLIAPVRAISQFSLGLRADLHGTGVRVTALEPGMAETEFTLVRTHGDQAASDTLYANAEPMTAGDIADTIFWIATLPAHLNINRPPSSHSR